MEDIESLDDWNAYDSQCGCCPMPLCPAPVLQCEVHAIELFPCGIQIGTGHLPDTHANCIVHHQFFKSYIETHSIDITKVTGSVFGGITTTVTEVWSGVYKASDTYAYSVTPSSGSSDDSGGSSSDDERNCFFTRLIEPGTGFSDYTWTFAYSGDMADIPTGSKLTQHDHRTQSYSGDPGFNRHTGCTSSNVITYKDAADYVDPDTHHCPPIAGPPDAVGATVKVISGTTFTYTTTVAITGTDRTDYIDIAGTEVATYEFADPVTVEDLDAEMSTRFAAWPYTGVATGGSGCSAERHLTLATCDTDSDSESESASDGDEVGILECPQSLAMQRMKYCFQIPVAHTGDIMNMDWQMVTFPEGYDPTDDSSPQPDRSEAEDKHYVWTGPGTGDQSDPSWLTPWSEEIAIASGNGSRRPVNLRITCYNSPFGAKPQFIGEQYIWPDATDSDSDED